MSHFTGVSSLILSVFSALQILNGPADTPYAGGIFKVDIIIPADYPFSPPKMRFITKGPPAPPALSLCSSVASKYLFSDRCHLSRHSQRPMVACLDHQDCPPLPPSVALLC
jgi:hypothetical protein